MKSKTVKALRALAKERGLKGYSKLSKDDLLRLLGEAQPDTDHEPAIADATAEASQPASAAGDAPALSASIEAVAGTARYETGQAAWSEAPVAGRGATRFSSEEERVEGAKYALAPGGVPGSEATTDLGEDIDRLPILREPLLRLLPQKPGILHAYWVVPPAAARERDLRLRLCRGEEERLDVWEEVPLPAAHGTWYFHVPETLHNQDAVLQLGYYRDGAFVSAIPRGMARIPSLYASGRTDRFWWIAEEDFRRLYLRAGGFEAGGQRRYGWAGSASSPGAALPGPGEERLAWPGGIGSRWK